jgi:hypothetical protein
MKNAIFPPSMDTEISALLHGDDDAEDTNADAACFSVCVTDPNELTASFLRGGTRPNALEALVCMLDAYMNSIDAKAHNGDQNAYTDAWRTARELVQRVTDLKRK